MKYQEFCEKFLRMCGHYNFCFECPLEDKYQEKGHRGCSAWCIAHPQEAEQILEQWSKEHPIITNVDKFKEVFGKPIGSYGVPCPNGLTIYEIGTMSNLE